MENDNVKFKNEFKKRLYNFVLKLVKFIDKLPKSSVNDINFFTHSLKSANESKVWVTLLRDTEKGDKNELNRLLSELIEIANILASSILTLKGKK